MEIVQKYNQTILEWSAEYQRLQAEGVQARDLPKKPKCAPSPVERPED